jgi:hypothetical protein
VCFEHTGYARQKAEQWWFRLLSLDAESVSVPNTVNVALKLINAVKEVDQKQKVIGFKEPIRIATRKNGKYTEVKDYEFNRTQRHQEAFGQPSQADQHH